MDAMKRVEAARAATRLAAIAELAATFNDRIGAEADELLANVDALGKPAVARALRSAIRLLEAKIFSVDLRTPLDVVDETVAKACGVPLGQLRKRSKERAGMRARHIAIAIAAEVTGYSLSRIARHYGQDHTTALHARRLISAAVASNALDVDFFALRDRTRNELAELGRGTNAAAQTLPERNEVPTP